MKNRLGLSATEVAVFFESDEFIANYAGAEDAIIIANKDSDCETISKLLKDRSPLSIQGRAKRLGLSIPIAPISTAGVLSRNIDDLCATSDAYTGVNGVKYIFAQCKHCQSVMLLPWDKAISFQHGDICHEYQYPFSTGAPKHFN